MKKIKHQKKHGFTLIELLIVIGIIAVLAAIIFVAVDPGRRFAEARDAQRWAEVNALLNAVLKCTVDSGGTLPSNLATATAGTYYLIGSGADATGCTRQATTAVLDLGASTCESGASAIVPNYISAIPVDPSGGSWVAAKSGYYIVKSAAGRITVGSCASERGVISVMR